MAQETGEDVTTSIQDSTTTNGNTNGVNTVTNGDSSTSTTIAKRGTGNVVDRTSRTGVKLTITPPTSLDLDKLDNIVNFNPEPERSSNNGSISSDQVFVDAAAALKAKCPVLSAHEEECTTEFLEIVNGARVSKAFSPLSWNAGVKFLMARKFNVRRALELYNQHQISRHERGLFNFNPDVEPLRSELTSGKFTVLPTRDLGGAAIAIFTANQHQPNISPHDITLKGVVYQLDAALEDPQIQRCGLIFIYDMSDSKYSHFDYDLSIKILSLLKGTYPARLKKVLIVTAPLWFRAPFRILRLFVREKLRERVFTVSVPQLGVHIPNNALPRTLGGQLDVNHRAWLMHCHQILGTTDLWGSFSDDNIPTIPIEQFSENNDNSMEENNKDSAGGDGASRIRKMRRNGTSQSQSTPSPTPNSTSGSSGFSDDDSLPFEEKAGLALSEFVEHLKQKGRRGLLDEYAEIVSKSPEGSFNASRIPRNVSKNRYSDVLCFDHTRVILSSENTESETPSDYINANYVDGYKQKNAFISTQGPLPRTYGDFWKMMWEQTVVLIVMTTRAVERGRTKCGQYWPPDQDATVTHEGYRLKNLEVDTRPDFAITKLLITNLKTNESRGICHLQFLSWPDYGVPSSAAATLKFIQTMRDEQAMGVAQLGEKWEGHPLGPPIVVHCSAGIGRTGTLCTMDISIKRLMDQGLIDVMGTVERIRSQRAYSIQVPEQYLFCHAAIIEYALSNALLTQNQLEDLPDLLAEAQQLAVEREREMTLAQKAAEALVEALQPNKPTQASQASVPLSKTPSKPPFWNPSKIQNKDAPRIIPQNKPIVPTPTLVKSPLSKPLVLPAKKSEARSSKPPQQAIPKAQFKPPPRLSAPALRPQQPINPTQTRPIVQQRPLTFKNNKINDQKDNNKKK